MKHRARQIFGILYNVVLFGAALFLPAGTFHWPRAWIFLALVSIATILTILALPEDLLKERMKSPLQKTQPPVDKVILIVFLLSYAGSLVLCGLDVFRYHFMAKPQLWTSGLGLALYALGWWISTAAILENSFAAAVVRLQEERGHHLVDTGPYRVVRHPMYSGLVPMAIGAPLWLESYAGALVGVGSILLIAFRIVFEERFLRRELSGYEEYSRRTQYRMIPYVW